MPQVDLALLGLRGHLDHQDYQEVLVNLVGQVQQDRLGQGDLEVQLVHRVQLDSLDCEGRLDHLDSLDHLVVVELMGSLVVKVGLVHLDLTAILDQEVWYLCRFDIGF